MKLAIKALFLIPLVFLISCSTIGETLDKIVGNSEEWLYANYGIPTNTFDIDSDTKMVVYLDSANMVMPSYGPDSTSYVQSYGNYATVRTYNKPPAQNISIWCEVTFIIKDGIVSSWRYKGNNCY